MSRKKMGIVAPLDRKNPGTTTLSLPGANRFDLYIIDLSSLSANGTAVCYNTGVNKLCSVSIDSFSLIHFMDFDSDSLATVPLRKKWMYVRSKLSIIKEYNVQTINPIPTLLYAMEKRYLFNLAEKGITIIKSNWISLPDTMEDLFRTYDPEKYLIKPANGECGLYSSRLSEMDPTVFGLLQFQSEYWLLQEYHEETSAGEYSLVFFRHRFSHGVVRIPRASKRPEFDIAPYHPQPGEIAFGLSVYAAYPYPLDVYRVDYFKSGEDLVLMEVEAVDPYHYACAGKDVYTSLAKDFYHTLIYS